MDGTSPDSGIAIGWEPWHGANAAGRWPPQPYVAPQPHTHYHYTPATPRLSDEDVDRIARRVVDLLKAAP